MGKVVCFGSLNIDHVYAVEHFVTPGETLACRGYRRLAGGKGNNQSTALARAGAAVSHAGKIGEDGLFLRDRLEALGADTSLMAVSGEATGHAMVQVDAGGENCIIIHGGANHDIDTAYAETVFARCQPGDWLVLQNEVNDVARLIQRGAALGMTVVFNPAPFAEAVRGYPLDGVRFLVLNEVEGRGLAGVDEPEVIVATLRERHPGMGVVLTLGARGALYADVDATGHAPAPVPEAVVDTTAAGDCFIGYLVASLSAGATLADAVALGCRAASVCVSRPGAADSIPYAGELPPAG